jgi:hypothetical protein
MKLKVIIRMKKKYKCYSYDITRKKNLKKKEKVDGTATV